MVGGALRVPLPLQLQRQLPGRISGITGNTSTADEEEQHLLSHDPNHDHNDADEADASSDFGLNAPILSPGSAKPPRRYRKPRPRRCRFAMYLLILVMIMAASIILKWRSERTLRSHWTPDRETHLFSQKPLGAPPQHLNISHYELPLRTEGRNVVDSRGVRFKLASVNWYGASDELFVVGGLGIQHRSVIAETIKRLGFNSVRLPYADELVVKNPKIESQLLSANPDLIGMHALDIYHAVITSLTDAGLAVIVNNHITSAKWCCGADPCDAAWANDHLGPICPVKQTEEGWIQNWEKVMLPHVENPLVIGADLRNEVRGLWGTMPWAKWATAAENCGNRLLRLNPDWLIVVEGTESANDLSGVRERPVELDVEHRLVYSAHVYGWSGWGSAGGRFVQRSYESFAKTMHANWGYILEEGIAPVWVGELGASHVPTKGSWNYWSNLFRYLKSVDADFGYWALNPRKPRKNAQESYALVADDYLTPIVDYRMKDMIELMKQ